MSRAYSSDLRQRIVDAISQGKSRRAAAADFKVSVATAVRLKQRSDRTGSVEPSRRGQPVGGGKLGPYRDAIIGKVEARPDITMPDLAIWLETSWRERRSIEPVETALPRRLLFKKLRKHKARTYDDLWKAIGKVCDLFSQQECWNYFCHAGCAAH